MFSDRLKELRIKNNMMQKELAEKLGVSNKSISAYENGLSEPNINTISKIADIFGVNAGYLLGGKDSSLGNVSRLYLLSKSEMPDEKTIQDRIDYLLDSLDSFGYVDGSKFIQEIAEATDEEKRQIFDYAKFLKTQRKEKPPTEK